VIATPACNDGGARERVPPASDSNRLDDSLVSILLCDIVSMLCMPSHGMSMFTEPTFFTEGDMAKKAKKAKKTAKAATKKVAKKTSKKKK
jgi:hypothetical protein